MSLSHLDASPKMQLRKSQAKINWWRF